MKYLILILIIPWWILGYFITEKVVKVKGPCESLASCSITAALLYPLFWPLTIPVDFLMTKLGYSEYSEKEKQRMETLEREEKESQNQEENKKRKIKELIGGIACVITDLKPVGQIEHQGRKIQARSEIGFIQKGSEVTITSFNGLEYLVKKSNSNKVVERNSYSLRS